MKYVAVALEESKKGESVVLLVSGEQEQCQKLESALKDSALPTLFKPSKILYVETIPVLGSGKVDLKGAKDLAEKLLG